MSVQRKKYQKMLLASTAFFLTACGGGGGNEGGGKTPPTPVVNPINPVPIDTVIPDPINSVIPTPVPTPSIIENNPKLLSLIYLGDAADKDRYSKDASKLLTDLSVTTLKNLYETESYKAQMAAKKEILIPDHSLPSGIKNENYRSLIDPNTSMGYKPGFDNSSMPDLMQSGPVLVTIPHAGYDQPPEFPHIPEGTKLTALLQQGGFAFFEQNKSSSIGIWGLNPILKNAFEIARAYSYNKNQIGEVNAKKYKQDPSSPAALVAEEAKYPSLQIGGTSTVKTRFVSINALPTETLNISKIDIEALTNAEFDGLGISEQDGLGLSYQYFPHLVAVEKGTESAPKVTTNAKSDGGVFAFGDRVSVGNVTLRDKTFIQTVGKEKDANKAVVTKVTLQDDTCGFILEAGKTLKVNTLDANKKTVNLKIKLSANTDTAPLEIVTISDEAAWSVSLDDYITNAEGRFEKKLFADGFDIKKSVPLVSHKEESLKDAKMDGDEKQFGGKSYKFSLDNKKNLLSMSAAETLPIQLFSASSFIATDQQFQGKNTDAVVAFAQEFNPSAHFTKGVAQHNLLASQHHLNHLRMGSDVQSQSNGFSGGIFAKNAAYISFSAPNQNNGLSSQAALKYNLGSLQLMPYISGQYLKCDALNSEHKGSMTSVGTMLLDRTKALGVTFTSSIGASIAQYSSDFTAKAPFEGKMITATAKTITYNTAEISGGVHIESKGLGVVSTFLSLIGTYQPQKQKLVSMNYGEKSYDTPLSLGGATYTFNTGIHINQSTKVGFSYANNGDTSLSFSVAL